MPTEQDILETCERLEGREQKGSYRITPVLPGCQAPNRPGFSALGTDAKVIVATNVAETSLTIPGIKYVVDTGLARISRYLPRTRSTSLPVSPISRSSARISVKVAVDDWKNGGLHQALFGGRLRIPAGVHRS